MMTTTKFQNTELGQLETIANDLANGRSRFYFSGLNAKAIKSAISSKKSQKEREAISLGGFRRNINMSGAEDTTNINLTLMDFKWLFDASTDMQNQFPSFDVFMQNIYNFAKDNSDSKTKATIARNNTTSQATLEFTSKTTINDDEEETVETSFRIVDLNTNISALMYKSTEPDKAWTLKHLCKDNKGQLYWRFNREHESLDGNDVYPLPIKSKEFTRYIMPDAVFWDAFFDEEMLNIKTYMEQAHEFILKFAGGSADATVQEITSDSELCDLPLIEAGLLSICPQAILRCLLIGFKLKKIGKKTFNMGPDIKLKSATDKGYAKSFVRENLQAVLAVALLQNIPMDELTTISVFDTVASKAIHKLPMRPIGLEIPDKHPSLLDYGCPNWHTFLRSTDTEGHTKFVSQRMGELRFAKAIVAIVDKDDYSRQILSIFSGGDTGKSIAFDAIAGIIGKNLVRTGLSQKDFTTEFGLQNSINRRVLVADDIPNAYEFITSDRVKRISGAIDGEIQINRKNDSYYTWNPSGCKIIMSTNSHCSLYDDASITRCMPLVFIKNYKYKDQLDGHELTNGLIKEGANFIKWCYAVCMYYNNIRNKNGERCPLFLGACKSQDKFSFIGKNLVICTDTQFDAWMSGELDLVPDSESDRRALRNEAYSYETTVPHKANPFVVIKQEDSEETEVTDYFEKICDILFKKDPSSLLTVSDMSLKFLEFIEMTDQDAKYSPVLKRLNTLLKACGFKQYHDMTKLKNSQLFRNFKQTLLDKFTIDCKRAYVDGHKQTCYVGLIMQDFTTMASGETAPTANGTASEDSDIF